jgi:hypothetical protein
MSATTARTSSGPWTSAPVDPAFRSPQDQAGPGRIDGRRRRQIDPGPSARPRSTARRWGRRGEKSRRWHRRRHRSGLVTVCPIRAVQAHVRLPPAARVLRQHWEFLAAQLRAGNAGPSAPCRSLGAHAVVLVRRWPPHGAFQPAVAHACVPGPRLHPWGLPCRNGRAALPHKMVLVLRTARGCMKLGTRHPLTSPVLGTG